MPITLEFSMLDVGLRGPDPGSTLISQTNPYTIGPFGISPRSADKVSPEAVWRDAGTNFLNPEMVVMSFDSFYPYLHIGHFALGLARLALYSILSYHHERIQLTLVQP